MERIETFFNMIVDYINSQDVSNMTNIVCGMILTIIFISFYKALSGIFSHK